MGKAHDILPEGQKVALVWTAHWLHFQQVERGGPAAVYAMANQEAHIGQLMEMLAADKELLSASLHYFEASQVAFRGDKKYTKAAKALKAERQQWADRVLKKDASMLRG